MVAVFGQQGIQIGDQIDQVVLDPVLAVVAMARDHRLSSLKIEVANLLERPRAESRVIVAYTQHVKYLFKEFAGVDVSAVYRDARNIPKYWKNELHSEEEISGRGLKDYLSLVGYPIGAHLGVFSQRWERNSPWPDPKLPEEVYSPERTSSFTPNWVFKFEHSYGRQ